MSFYNSGKKKTQKNPLVTPRTNKSLTQTHDQYDEHERAMLSIQKLMNIMHNRVNNNSITSLA